MKTPPSIEVIKSGSHTSIQGFGLYGMGSQGVAPGGVMDRLSARIANLLVLNPPDATVLEFTLLGPELLFLKDHTVSVFGGEFKVLINEKPQPTAQRLAVKKGDRLKIAHTSWGVRGYLAVSGGFGSPHSIFHAGDLIAVKKPKSAPKKLLLPDASRIQSTLRHELQNPIRVLLGPQAHFFSKPELERFVTARFRVSPHSNRMGVRLEGVPLRHEAHSEIPSEANTCGAIQVPPSGLPIILGADLPITGGYPKIATVIERDHWRIAQARPGDELRFEWCTLEEARRLRDELEKQVKSC